MKYQLFFYNKIISSVALFSLLILFSCANESDTVNPNDEISSFLTDLPGTVAITGTIAYPAPAETDIPVNSKIVLVFSHDILPASANASSISIAPAVAGPHAYNVSGHIVTVTLGSSMAFSTLYTVSVNTNLLGLDSRHISTNYAWNFTTAPGILDAYQPRVIIRYPIPGQTGVSVNQNYIEATFNEAVSNVTPATFSISGGVTVSGTSNVAGTNTWRLNLTSKLLHGTLYTVNLTTAVTDSSSNPLVADTWNFTTENAPPADPALVLFDNQISNTTDSASDLFWKTNAAVDSTNVSYGISTVYPAAAVTSYPTAGESQVFSVNLTGLAPGTLYYYTIAVTGATPAVLEGSFFTKFSANPGTQTAAGDNSSLKTVQLKNINGIEDGSSVGAYMDGTNVKTTFFNASGTTAWGNTVTESGSASSFTIASDCNNGFFLTTVNGGTVNFRRIFNSSGIAYYYSHTDATGLSIAAGSSPSAVLTYGGQGNSNVYPAFVTNSNVYSGTATMNIPLNAFFDFDNDFTAGVFSAVGDGDIIAELSGGLDGTTAIKSTSNYRHAMGQTAISVASGNVYQFASSATTDSFTAENHTIRNASTNALITAYTSGTNIYSGHNTSPSAWTPPAWLNAGDISHNGTGYGSVISGPTVISPFAAALVYSGTTHVTVNSPSCDYAANLLVPDFGSGGSLGIFSGFAGYLTLNTTDATAARASSVTTYFDDSDLVIPYDYETDALNLTAGIFDNTSAKSFGIYSRYCAEHTASAYQIQPFFRMTSDISVTNGNIAAFFDSYSGATGTADIPPTNPVYSDGIDLSAAAVNDIIINTSDFGAAAATPNYSMINYTAFSTSGALGMNSTAAAIINGNSYRIMRFTAPVQRNYMIETGICTSAASDKLIAAGADFSNARPSVNAAVRVSPGDIVYNITQNRYAVVTNIDSPTQLSLSRDIFSTNDLFIVFYTLINALHEPVIDCGTATAANTDSGADFVSAGVQPGDILRNITQNSDSLITARTPTTITLFSGTLNNSDSYIIIQSRFSVVYSSGGNILARHYRMGDASQYNAAAYNIYNGTDNMLRPKTARGLNGNYYVVYYDSTNGNAYAKVINGIGNIITGGISTNTGINILSGEATEIRSLSNGSALFVMGKNAAGTQRYLNKYDSALNSVFTKTFTASDSSFSLDSLGNSYAAHCSYTPVPAVTVEKYNAAGTPSFAAVTINLNTLSPTVYISKVFNISIVPDGNGGAFVSWFDDRYFTIEGYHLVSIHVDSAGVVDDSSAAYQTGVTSPKYIGRIFAVPSVYNEADLSSALLYYNDGGAPFGALHLWIDYRITNDSNIYYLTQTH